MEVAEVISYMETVESIDYYANQFPERANDCAVVRVEGGEPPNHYIIGLTSPNIQIIVRHRQASEAERIAKKIWKHFHGREHFEIGSSYVYGTFAEQSEPIYLDHDDNGRSIYSINIACKVRQ
ncbi:minor capsid protein [Halobacillus ihumii]|uniref:minor capsid protein n=1 Tax=Halobacillus ihumii TaxID=2686092 RepID=UPI0013D6CCF8|nr:minor capsid protein [Halobacillus ihumii]